jgi:diketogulonate reductase-like aldo/keto reductase
MEYKQLGNTGVEDVVGAAIKDIRDQVLIASKVSGSHLQYAAVLRAAEASLRTLDIACIDLY